MTAAPLAVRDGSSRPAPPRRPFGSSWWAWVFVLPTVVGIGVLYVAPMLASLVMSLFQWSTFEPPEFVGWENLARLVGDERLGRAAVNTLAYTALSLLSIPIAVVLAALLERPGLRFAGLYRALFFLPYIAMPTAISMVWRMIFHSDHGIVNTGLGALGLPTPRWITTEWLALLVVAIVGIWMAIGFKIIVLGAGLRTIPPEVYEAASLDGAGTWRQFWSITVPMLSPSIFFLSVTSAISGFQLFDLLFAVLGESNPAMRDSESLVFLFYREAFAQDDKGYASAIALLVLVLVGAVTLLQFSLQKRWVTYD